MKTLEQLKKEATESAEFRGHRITWIDTITRRGMRTNGSCGCGEWVQVLTNPMPNDIAIGGTAVALNCALKERHTIKVTGRLVGRSELYKALAIEYSQQARRT